jgi:hypothetical protein
MQPIANLVADEIKKRKLYMEFTKGFQLIVDQNGMSFSIVFQGVSALTPDEVNFIVRELAELIYEIGLEKIIYINGTAVQVVDGDFPFTSKIYESELTLSQKLVDICQAKNEDIPERFICAVSSQLMDDPVYFQGSPDIIFDYNKIRFWLYKQDIPRHPHTRVPVKYSQIIHDFALKAEINSFKTDLIYNASVKANRSSSNAPDSPVARMGQAHEQLEKHLNQLLRGKSSYQGIFEAINSRHYSKALRRACTCKDLPLAFEISRIILDFINILPINLNEQAGERNRAAIHYAVENANLPLVKFLISKGADKLLEDLQGLSARDFLISVSSPDITII